MDFFIIIIIFFFFFKDKDKDISKLDWRDSEDHSRVQPILTVFSSYQNLKGWRTYCHSFGSATK